VVRKEDKDCCSSTGTSRPRCAVEAVLTLDDRGQILLPKDLREKLGLKAGDKLVAISCCREGETCCITLIQAEKLAESVRQFLGPLLKELIEV